MCLPLSETLGASCAGVLGEYLVSKPRVVAYELLTKIRWSTGLSEFPYPRCPLGPGPRPRPVYLLPRTVKDWTGLQKTEDCSLFQSLDQSWSELVLTSLDRFFSQICKVIWNHELVDLLTYIVALTQVQECEFMLRIGVCMKIFRYIYHFQKYFTKVFYRFKHIFVSFGLIYMFLGAFWRI